MHHHPLKMPAKVGMVGHHANPDTSPSCVMPQFSHAPHHTYNASQDQVMGLSCEINTLSQPSQDDAPSLTVEPQPSLVMLTARPTKLDSPLLYQGLLQGMLVVQYWTLLCSL